jgi:hypothetical protein
MPVVPNMIVHSPAQGSTVAGTGASHLARPSASGLPKPSGCRKFTSIPSITSGRMAPPWSIPRRRHRHPGRPTGDRGPGRVLLAEPGPDDRAGIQTLVTETFPPPWRAAWPRSWTPGTACGSSGFSMMWSARWDRPPWRDRGPQGWAGDGRRGGTSQFPEGRRSRHRVRRGAHDGARRLRGDRGRASRPATTSGFRLAGCSGW